MQKVYKMKHAFERYFAKKYSSNLFLVSIFPHTENQTVSQNFLITSELGATDASKNNIKICYHFRQDFHNQVTLVATLLNTKDRFFCDVPR